MLLSVLLAWFHSHNQKVLAGTPMLPDGPRTLPGVQLLQWITDLLKFMETSQARYGDSFTARLSSPLVFLSHPQAIQQIFTAPPQQFDSGRANEILQPWVGDQSLLLLDGDRHQSQRRLLTPPFTWRSHASLWQDYPRYHGASDQSVAPE